jgi:hypothetical protein
MFSKPGKMVSTKKMSYRKKEISNGILNKSVDRSPIPEPDQQNFPHLVLLKTQELSSEVNEKLLLLQILNLKMVNTQNLGKLKIKVQKSYIYIIDDKN